MRLERAAWLDAARLFDAADAVRRGYGAVHGKAHGQEQRYDSPGPADRSPPSDDYRPRCSSFPVRGIGHRVREAIPAQGDAALRRTLPGAPTLEQHQGAQQSNITAALSAPDLTGRRATGRERRTLHRQFVFEKVVLNVDAQSASTAAVIHTEPGQVHSSPARAGFETPTLGRVAIDGWVVTTLVPALPGEHRLPREQPLPAPEPSGRQRQRVALAQALVHRRPMHQLDEPFAALGPALRHETLELLGRLRIEERRSSRCLVIRTPLSTMAPLFGTRR